MLEELKTSFKEYLQEKNITTITKEVIEEYITYIYYELFDELESPEEISSVENDIREKLYSIYNIK